MSAVLQFKSFRLFISSPGDVAPEREQAKRIIDAVNRTARDLLRLNFHIESWESLPPRTPGRKEGTIQELLNKLVEKSHLFVLILNKRYGQVEKGHTKSNTEREIDTILARHRSSPRVTILSYFKTLKPEEMRDPGEQLKQVVALRRRLQENGIFYKEFDDARDFADKFAHDLYATALKLGLSPFKTECLSRFWNIAFQDDPTSADLVIVYRPVTTSNDELKRKNPYWHSRLMPSVALEDTKAIQKIQKNMRLLNLRTKVYRCTELPANIDSMNRLWICAPRIPKAQELLKRYGSRIRFRFEKRGEAEASLYWRTKSGNEFAIKSPMSAYLREQRNLVVSDQEWTGSLSRGVAKDFAVIARFRDSEEDAVTDFVIAGIRGLGTWGAAWYLDRKYKELLALPEDRDVQMLLEVVYRDGSIDDVTDVTRKGQDYFRGELMLRKIRSVIVEANNGGAVR